MKNLILFLLLLGIWCPGCTKEEEQTTDQQEVVKQASTFPKLTGTFKKQNKDVVQAYTFDNTNVYKYSYYFDYTTLSESHQHEWSYINGVFKERQLCYTENCRSTWNTINFKWINENTIIWGIDTLKR